MSADVEDHTDLHECARRALGERAARTLMTRLPWDVDELTTKTDIALLRKDLDLVETRLGGKLDAMEARFGERLEATARSITRTTVFSFIGANAAMLTGAAALARWFG